MYGYLEKIYRLPGFDPLTGYLSNLGGADTQIPTLSSDPRQPAGIYYVDNSSNLDIVYLGNGTQHVIAPVAPLYQTYAAYNEMLDNEFFVEFGYDQALFFGTTTSSGTSYSIELVNLTTGHTQLWNTPAAVDSYNQQPQYVGNNTVVVMSSNCSILAWNLASRQEWSAGTLGASFGGGSTCFEANNAYWFPQKQEIINVEAHGGSGDHVEQLNASFDAQGRIHFASVATIAVDSGVVFNWVNGIAYNASSDEIAFSAGYLGREHGLHLCRSVRERQDYRDRAGTGTPPTTSGPRRASCSRSSGTSTSTTTCSASTWGPGPGRTEPSSSSTPGMARSRSRTAPSTMRPAGTSASRATMRRARRTSSTTTRRSS